MMMSETSRVGLIRLRVRSGAGTGMLAELLAAHVYGLPPERLRSAGRADSRAVEARQVAMYLSHVVLGQGFSEIARYFGRDRTTARHACRLVESMREDPVCDRVMAWMEAILRQAARLSRPGEPS